MANFSSDQKYLDKYGLSIFWDKVRQYIQNRTFIGRTDGIISNTDADNFTDSGAYLFQTGNGNNNTNFPITGYGILNVFNSPYGNRTTNYVGQLLLGTYSAFYRTKVDTWSDWKRIALTSDIPTKLSQLTDDVVAGKYLPLSGGNIVSDKESILTIRSSSPNSYAMFYANGTNRASVGYYKGLGYIANEISYARIGVTDTGEPQYWDSYRDDANKYTLLHSGNIGNYKLSQFTDDVVAGKYLPTTIYGSFDADTLFNDGFRSGSILHLPSGSPYGMVHTLSYKGGSNNAKPDYGAQIFIPCGDDRTNPNDMFFRTSLANAWHAWNKVITDKNIGNHEAGSSVWSKGLNRIPSITAGGHCVYFYSGQPALGDDINNAKEGSNAYHLWSYPVDSTSVANGTANIMNLRLQWDAAYLHDIFVSPNRDDVWHRSIISQRCGPWRKFAFTDSNVASATKLATPRKLWGNDFDGTADVNGLMYVCNEFHIEHPTTGRQLGMSPYWTILGYNNTTIGNPTYVDGRNVYIRYGNDEYVSIFASNGNVGIGNTSPTERLDVSGNIKASGDITANKFIGSIRGNIIYDNGTDEGHFIGLGSNGVGVKGLLNYVYGNFPILFYTNGFERMRIGEYVGIGNTSPTEKLDVTGNVKANGFIKSNSSDSYVLLGGGGHKAISDFADTNYYHTRSYSSGLQISTGTGVSNMYVPYATASQAGVVSTGSQTFAGAKIFNSTVKASAFYIDSDERLKTFGDDIKVDFDELAKLRKSHFVFNDNPTKQEIGVSAQEVQKIYPEIVNETEEGTLSVDYSKLAVVALAAIDKLNQRVQELENKLAKYE